MKFIAFSLALLATVSAVSAAALPDQDGEKLADGYYSTIVNEVGDEITEFTPWKQLGNQTFVPIVSVVPAAAIKQRSALSKRREGCHGSASVPEDQTDAANKCLLDSFASDPVKLGNGNKQSCLYQNALSYVCPYSSVIKHKSDIAGTWDYVKRSLCGTNHLGYAQVINGEGDMTAGYTYNGDGFC